MNLLYYIILFFKYIQYIKSNLSFWFIFLINLILCFLSLILKFPNIFYKSEKCYILSSFFLSIYEYNEYTLKFCLIYNIDKGNKFETNPKWEGKLKDIINNYILDR